MRPGHFFTELKRRHVLRVVGAYAVAAWVAVEVYTTIQPILLPDHEWTNRLFVIVALAGFPLTFALAWIFDITPHGVRRTAALRDPAADAVAVAAAPARRTLSRSATGFFGLGMLVALGSFAAYAGLGRLDGDTTIRSLAVLPFEDMSSTRDQQFFSDAIAEELLNRLSQLTDTMLRVSPRTSSFALAAQGLDTRAIGQRLGVQALLEGSVRRESDRVRVTARLVRVVNGDLIWSGTFEGDATDVFALEDSIATAIAQAVRVHLTTHAAAGDRYTRNALAAELYMQGMNRWHLRTDRDLRQARDYFERAIAEDPQFALAHAALAQTYAVLPTVGAFPVDSAVARGYAAAALAVGLDPSLAQAYAAMGQIVQNFEWDLAGAESHYLRALQYSNDAPTYQSYAETLLLMGRHDDARRALERVRVAGGTDAALLYSDAFLRTASGQTEAGLAAWRELTLLHPDFTAGVLGYAYAALAAGRAEQAAGAAELLASRLPARAPLYQTIARALREPAQRADAVRLVSAAGDVDTAAALPASERAAWLLALGDRAGAVATLQQAYELHTDANLPFLLAHPLLTPVRGDTAIARMRAEIRIG